MKTLILIILLLFFACEKDIEPISRCWNCIVTTTYIRTENPEECPYEIVLIGKFLKCDMTSEEINKWIEINSYDYPDEITEIVCKPFKTR